jgi:DNA-binding transcriptional MerR regulator
MKKISNSGSKTFTIGQMAECFGINIQTLYYYDKIGLFSPYSREGSKDVRKYDFNQLNTLASILYLKKLGLSIDEIKEQMAGTDAKKSVRLLLGRSEKLRFQWEELLQIDDAIHRKIEFVQQAYREYSSRPQEKIVWRDTCHYIPMGDEYIMYSKEIFYFYPTIALYDEGGKSFGAMLDEISYHSVDAHLVHTIPSGWYFISYHCGPYETIVDHMVEIMQAHPELKLKGNVVDFNIIDQFLDTDPEHYITRLEYPLIGDWSAYVHTDNSKDVINR